MIEKVANLITRGKSSIWLPLVFLALSCILFDVTDLDLLIQDNFYNAETNSWLLNFSDSSTLTFFLYYKLPKGLVIIFAVVLLVKMIVIKVKKENNPDFKKMLYVFICMALIPSAVGLIKMTNNMPYPYKIQRYGGQEPRRNLVEAFSREPLPSGRRYKGWPGSQASAGFAILGLAFIFKDPKKRLKAFVLITIWGLLVGMGHTVDGNHFFSHNLASYFIGWVICSVLYRMYSPCTSSSSSSV